MLSDPLSVTIGSDPGAVSVPRVSTGNGTSRYQSADGLVTLTLSSSYGKRTRRVARVDRTKVSSDVFIPANNVQLSASVYVVFDHPVQGFTSAEMVDMMAGLFGLLTASTNADAVKLLGGES
jgi:hypothetical protein